MPFVGELDDKMKWLKNFERLLEIQRSIVWPSVFELDPKAFIPDVSFQTFSFFLFNKFIFNFFPMQFLGKNVIMLQFCEKFFKGKIINIKKNKISTSFYQFFYNELYVKKNVSLCGIPDLAFQCVFSHNIYLSKMHQFM